jgi:hypothetical protein
MTTQSNTIASAVNQHSTWAILLIKNSTDAAGSLTFETDKTGMETIPNFLKYSWRFISIRVASLSNKRALQVPSY